MWARQLFYVVGPRGIPPTDKDVGSTPSRHRGTITPAGFEAFLETLRTFAAGSLDVDILAPLAMAYDFTVAKRVIGLHVRA